MHRREDREDFLSRLEALAREKAWVIYAWSLMPNHFHLLFGTEDLKGARGIEAVCGRGGAVGPAAEVGRRLTNTG